jgi:small subunit ribosomal protein S20
MANIASSIKRARQTGPRTARNQSVRSRLKTARKAVRNAIAKGEANAVEKFRQAVSLADKAAKGSVLHRNAARRIQSRLAKRLHAATKQA